MFHPEVAQYTYTHFTLSLCHRCPHCTLSLRAIKLSLCVIIVRRHCVLSQSAVTVWRPYPHYLLPLCVMIVLCHCVSTLCCHCVSLLSSLYAVTVCRHCTLSLCVPIILTVRCHCVSSLYTVTVCPYYSHCTL